MKTAISIPDDVFRTTNELAMELNISRSAVFALGVKTLRQEIDRKAMVERINEVCAEVDTSIDPVWKEYTRRRLSEVEW